ncbi:hypothetical protein [Cerasicoccus fimbriatus]|uniref:hypothetical protein n=1 Tax=Cerasicoccus fimbriatus TaxID=3014554 RepID=UPI0022B52716|nr:hypothetical protein [Cerasicoccus sp. TK19100]
MNQKHTLSGKNCPRLPKKILARINGLYNHTTLPSQTTSFAVDLPTPDGKRYRWNAKFPELPYPHIVAAEDFGRKITLHILHHECGECLTLAYAQGKWSRKSSTSASSISGLLPKRYQHDNKKWYHYPATKPQVKKVAEILHTDPENLPQLTAYNAALLVDTYILMPHLAQIYAIVDLWISQISATVHEPLLPFMEAESA